MKRRAAVAAGELATVGFVATIVLGFVPVWPLSLLEHFRVQCLLGGIAVVAIAFWLRRGLFDAALIALLVDALVVVPDLSASARAATGVPIRFLFANVLTSNPHHDRVRALVDQTRPDIIAFVETDQRWFDALAPSLADYQRLEHPRRDNFGLAIYARGAVTGRVEHLGSDLPTIVAEVALPAAHVSVVVTHPWPPTNRDAADAQDVHLAAVASRIGALRGPVIFAGDLNATPWSRPFARVIGATGLCDTRAGFGYQGTYPASSVIVRIPIDHVLVSCDIGVRDRWIGPDLGSDHLPVIVDLSLPLPRR